MKALLILIMIFALGCSAPRSYYVPDHMIKGEDTEAKYTIKVTEKGLRRLEIATRAYKKGTKYSKGYSSLELALWVTGAFIIAGGIGYYGGE